MSDTRTRIVFLDFDGVLNSHAFQARLGEGSEGSKSSGVMGLDPIAVQRLNRIHPYANFVVSSTWRFGRTLDELRGLLYEKGFFGTVYGMTPERLQITPGGLYAGERRGHEIQAWLDGALNYGISVGSFVILDDDSDMAHLRDRLVKTDFATGLLDEHVDRVLDLLNQPLPLVVTP